MRRFNMLPRKKIVVKKVPSPLNKILATKELRERSGTIKINSKLVSFLYQLMRDHVPAGVIESVVNDSQDPDVTYTNGYLAKYAEDVAARLEGK